MSDLAKKAIERFNEMNSQDPNTWGDDERPRELVHAERLEKWVHKVAPTASLALRIAARSQHLMRWTVPRSDYPEGRTGYLKWRKDLGKRHAELAAEVLRDLGAEKDLIQQVKAIHLKEAIRENPDGQVMEDALCLTFLEHEFSAFAEKHPDEKVIDIVRKTWRKMSARGHELALQLPLEGREKNLVSEALGAA